MRPKSRAYCAKCRRAIDRETYNIWQGTAWCGHCRAVVSGTMTKVPFWVVAIVLLLSIQLQLQF